MLNFHLTEKRAPRKVLSGLPPSASSAWQAFCPRTPIRRSEGGIALVTVLCLLVLIVALALGIFYSATLERRLSAQFSAGLDGQRLVDTSVNLVIAQITDAAEVPNRAWVTQPGMIRTFTGNRQGSMNYRLYSAGQMRVPGDYEPEASGNAVPVDWWQNKALYSDLNEPVPDRTNSSDATADKYPIFYPPDMIDSAGTNHVAGYAVTNQPVAATGSITNSVPMPVQWLYVLQDGTLVPGVDAGTGKVNVAGATTANPIAGRIAFWTDDECSKVNVNTAGGGEFWTTPWFHTRNEQNPANSGTGVKGFGFSKPVRNEFQRYPGHPYTTDLRAVFPELSLEEIYEISPRIVPGGSSNGLAATDTLSDLIENDRARLYSTVGELFYSTNFTGGDRTFFFTNRLSNWREIVERREAFITAASRAPELTLSGTPRVSIWPVHAVTNIVSGRNPVTFLTATDRLLAFCSTIKSGTTNYPFYFSRGGATGTNSLSPSVDINLTRNQQIFAYLQRECANPFPGASSASFASKYGNLETDQILTEVFDYIRSANITDLSSIQGGAWFNQESAVVPVQFTNNVNGPTFGFGRSLTVRQIGLHFICNASGEPIAPYTLKYTNASGTNIITGITRNKSNYPPGIVTFTNVTINGSPVVSTNVPASDILTDTANFQGPNRALDDNTSLAPDERRVQALLALEFMSPSAGGRGFSDGFSGVRWHYRLRDLGGGTNGLQSTLSTAATSTNLVMGSAPVEIGQNLVSGGFAHPGLYGGAFPYKWAYSGRSVFMNDLATVGNLTNIGIVNQTGNPYVTQPLTIRVDTNLPTMDFGGATVGVDVWHPRVSTTNAPSRVINMNLPAVQALPVPSLVYTNATNLMVNATNWVFHYCGPFGTGGLGTNGGIGSIANSGRFRNTTLPSLVRSNDTVQTYVASHGDSRLLFTPALNNMSPVPASSTAPSMRHILLENFLGNSQNTNRAIAAYGFNTGSRLATNSAYSPGDAPAILPPAVYPSSPNAPWTFGDWDTGSPMQVGDGPLINKPDEGILGQITALTQNPYARVGIYYGHGAAFELSSAETRLGYITPNRQMPSAVMFGSLPTGVVAGKPWQTLLFRPDPGGHPGAAAPADHLLLDLFWMPIAEPYPISEPFSTAGKINMNFQIVPFTYIKRSTGMRAVLMNEKIAHGPSAASVPAAGYGKVSGYMAGVSDELRMDIDVDKTLQAFEDNYFSKGKLFITPSEITTMDLIPSGGLYSSAADLWKEFPLTGENIKERPYATIYPRLTTKSNVYNVHYRVQVLRKRPGSDQQVWDEAKDVALAQRRGNSIIERYLDMNRTGIPDYSLPVNAGLTAETLYRFRILSNQEFNP